MPLKTICLPAGTEHVQFGELAHLIANALHPLSDGATDSEMMAYGGARINLEAELEQAVEADTLPVKDPLTLGPHTFPVGDALRRSRVMVADLRAFLADRPVTVEIAPALNSAREPGFYTLEEAAQAIATNLGWHDGARDTLKNQLMDAARDGLLTVRHPHTDVPYRPVTVREFNELVTPTDVNEWAARVGVSWRWELPTPEPKAAPVITFASFGKSAFMQLIRHEEKRLMAHEARADGVYVRAPDASEIRLGLTEPQAIHPTGDYDAPALPFPFTLAQFLAFEKTAGIVGQMHDDEIDALKDKAPMPYQLAMAARYVEAGGNVNDLMQAPEPQAAPVVPDSSSGEPAGPLPLTTGDIAFLFAGLRWNEQGWKKPLGDKPKWLEACVVIPGQRGVSETRWNPVCIGAALERQGHVDARSVRAAFQTKPLLAPWLDAWKTYEADYLDNN